MDLVNNLDILAHVATSMHTTTNTTSRRAAAAVKQPTTSQWLLLTPQPSSEDDDEQEHAEHMVKEKNAYRLPESAKTTLRQWFDKNLEHPYPPESTKHDLRMQTGLTMRQVNNFFINVTYTHILLL